MENLDLGLKPIQRWRLQIPKLQDRTEKSFLRFLKSSNIHKEFLDSKQIALESAFFDNTLNITDEDLKKLDEEVTEIMKNRKKIKKDSPATPAKVEENKTSEQTDDTKSKEKQVKQEDETNTVVAAPSEVKKEDELTEEQKKIIEDLQAKLNELKTQKSKSFTLLKTVIDEEEKLKKEKKVLKQQQQQQQMYSNDPKSPLSANIPPPHSPMSSPLLGHFQNMPPSVPPHQTLHMQQLSQTHHGMHPQPPPPPLQIPQNIPTTQANLISGNEMIPPQHQMVHSTSQGSLPTPPSAGNTSSSASHYHRDHHYHQPTYSGHYSHSLPPYSHSNYHHPSSNVYHPPQTNAVPTGLQQGLLHTPPVSAPTPSSTIMDSNNPNTSGRNAPPAPMPPGHSGFDSPYGVNPPMQGTGMHHAPFSHFPRHGLPPPPPPPSYHNEMPPQHHHHHSYTPYHVPPPRGQNYYQPYGAPPRFNHMDRGGHSRTHQRNWR